MPLIATLFAWLLSFLPVIVLRIVTALGVGVVSYTGINVLLQSITDSMQSAFSGAAGDVAGILGLMQFDQAASIIMSAIAVKFAIQTVNGVISKVTLTNKAIPS